MILNKTGFMKGGCEMQRNMKGTIVSGLRSAVLLVLCVLLIMPMIANASESSDVYQMLDCYKNKQYASANSIAKKYAGKKANEKKYRKKLSKKARSAYKKVLKSYRLYDSDSSDKAHLWNYFVKDLDGTGQPELCIYYGSCEADVRLRVYRFTGKKVKLVAQSPCSHGRWADIPNSTGVIYSYGHMGFQSVSVVTLVGNRLVFTLYGGHIFDYYSAKRVYDYIEFPFAFPDHVKHKSNNKNGYHSYDVLSYSGV